MVNWYLIFPAIVMVFIIIKIRGVYVKTARELKRYEGMGRHWLYLMQ